MSISNNPPEEPGYGSLVEAIVLQACTDYLNILVYGHAPFGSQRVNKEECERFFLSDWFTELAPLSMSGESVIRKMNSVAQKIINIRYIPIQNKRGVWGVWDKREKRFLDEMYDSGEAARAIAAEKDGLAAWQMTIAMYGEIKRGRKPKNEQA